MAVLTVYGWRMTSNPIFNQDDVATVDYILHQYPHSFPSSRTLFPSSRALRRGLDTFQEGSPNIPYLIVSVGADPAYLDRRIANIDIRVRKDQVDAFVRHLATDPEIHTIKVGRTTVYLRPDEVPSGIIEDTLAALTA